MATQNIDLSKLFGTVAQTMVQNKTSLNQQDTYNHDHGDNMVQIFEVITQAMKEKSTATPAEQLAYASRLLSAKSQSGSAKLYAQGLSDASKKFQGKKAVNPNNAMTLIQTLLGAQKSIPVTSTPNTQTGSGADLLGSLLDGLTGTASTPNAQAPGSTAGADLLGSLLGGLIGTSSGAPASTSAQPGKIDITTLLKAGMTYMQAKQSGSSNLDAILSAVVGSSRMSDSAYRSQSGTLVASTLMKALTKMSGR